MPVLNWKLAAHPMNWLVVIFMLIIAGMAGHLLLQYFGVNPATAPAE